ncbi:MAG: division/cell wall cluster transcriptional repressor MraZ [Clostridia bacterium]|nr:division/cell wall cluster transcriptional repressor MraZ [Clostridia bacterium]MBQ3868363.1 division/cell wall cluster transcriptional repressor MraZ [Clostridia bacterium]MBR0159369.1 division/cell wall cluster transcriptional repressor MraZ [Clostridia bacterium]MBR7061441.1 division/cell wall cluster transcriptional repressor MraZ [Clostridia bacterium]
MLTGGFEGVVDAKSRVVLPSKLRNELGEKFHLMMGFDTYVAIYPEENFNEMLSQLMQMKKSSDEYLVLGRYLLGNAYDGELDTAGRVLIPAVLKKFARLDKEVHIMGVGDHIEIWDSETYQNNQVLSAEMVQEARKLMNY